LAEDSKSAASRMLERRRASIGVSAVSLPAPWTFDAGLPPKGAEVRVGALATLSLLERPSMESIAEDETLVLKEDDEDSSDDSRDVTPMFIPGICDHATLEDATARFKRRHRQQHNLGGYAWNA